MKKVLALILVLSLAASMIAACGGSADDADETTPDVIETEAVSDDGGVDGPVISNGDEDGMDGMINPVHEVTIDEQEEMSGIRLEAPEGAEGVAYFVITPKDEEPMAQTVFTIDGAEFCYRAEPTSQMDAFDNSGMYYEWEEEGAAVVDYCNCYYGVAAEAAVCYWLDVVPGINYSLSTVNTVDAEQIVTMANTVFVPTQGEA